MINQKLNDISINKILDLFIRKRMEFFNIIMISQFLTPFICRPITDSDKLLYKTFITRIRGNKIIFRKNIIWFKFLFYIIVNKMS